MPHSRPLLVAAVLAAIALAGCATTRSDAPSPSITPPSAPSATTPPAPRAPAEPRSYIALGDSFTAGPGIGSRQDGSGLCQRSTANWPSVLATSLDLALTDVSCAGATTTDLTSTADNVPGLAEADLVTVSAGGNDGALFLSLIRACTGGDGRCASFVDDRVPDILERSTTDLASLLRTVSEAAPRARVVLVGYPGLMPASGTCDSLGIAPADVSTVAAAEAALDAALDKAATSARVGYVSLRDASRGHDACAGTDAWTNGQTAAGDGIMFHPTARGMRAVADLVAASIR